MTLKIKPPRPKMRRRGNYLYIEFPGGETHVMGSQNGKAKVVEIYNANCRFIFEASGCGEYARAEGVAKIEGEWVSVEYAMVGGYGYSDRVAGRYSSEDPWWFWDDDPQAGDIGYVSASQLASITNKALIAAALVEKRIP